MILPEGLRSWAPMVLAVAPNGARKTKKDHPALPISPAELAREARACVEAGAAMIHLHVRKADETHSLDVALYRAAIAAIRAEVGDEIVIQVTSEAVGIYSAEEQMAMVRELRPEAVSLALRELVPPDGAEAAEAQAADFFHWLAGEAIFPQFILYSAEDLKRLDALAAKGVLPKGRQSVLFVLGRYAKDQTSHPLELLPFLNETLQGHRWSLCAFGPREAACAAAAASLGGDVRVGFENNLLLPDGSLAQSNAQSVALAAKAAETIGRPLASAREARRLFAALKDS